MITKEDLAKLLNGKEYREEIAPEILLQAKENGLVIVYGYSDDLMELEGAITDEGNCYGGALFYLTKDGLLPDFEDVEDDEEATEEWIKHKKAAKKIEAIRCADNEPRWTYITSIPHATFNVMDDGEVQCRGLVFNITDL